MTVPLIGAQTCCNCMQEAQQKLKMVVAAVMCFMKRNLPIDQRQNKTLHVFDNAMMQVRG